MLKWLSLLDGEWVSIVWNLLETEDEFRHVDMFMNKRREKEKGKFKHKDV